MVNQSQQFTRILHWLSAVLLIGLLASGIYMADGHNYALYDWHKAFGVMALLLVIVRLYYRAKNPWPSAARGTAHEKPIHLMHQSLLLICVMLPITGMLYSGLGGFGIEVFGLTLVPNGYTEQGEVLPYSQEGSDFGKIMHYYLGYLMAALVLLHASAALKHHFVDQDSTLLNMVRPSKNSLTKHKQQGK
ncbi:cytochrome b [Alishewanella longhuensis]